MNRILTDVSVLTADPSLVHKLLLAEKTKLKETHHFDPRLK